jgi:hypothetical protein
VNELEQRLVALGHALDVPAAPDVAPRVLAQLGDRRPAPQRAAPQRRRLVMALAVVVLAAFLATLAIPDARSALLRFLQIGGARIELVDELPPVPQTPPELELTLGERVSLDEARRRAAFELLELDENPDAVYLGERGTVWFVYGQQDAVRLLVAQTPELTIDEPFLLKKLAGSGTQVEPDTVRGRPAYFLSGAPHAVLLLDEFGIAYEETARLARDVLLWDEDGRTIRLEGDLTLEEAVEIAESLD